MERRTGEFSKGILTHVLGPLLSEIPRYQDVEMIHRTSNLVHALRTTRIAEAMAWFLKRVPGQQFDPDLSKVRYFSAHHDDHEIITGDIPAPFKAGFTEDQRIFLREKEEEAARTIARELGLVGDDYEAYVAASKEVHDKQTIEAKIVKIADNFDALGEILHEIRCGNNVFLPKLDFTRARLKELETTYEFFPFIAKRFALRQEDIPTSADTHPRIHVEQLRTRKRMQEQLYYMITFGEPESYRIWLGVSCSLLSRVPEVTVFPGWEEQLQSMWRKKKSN